MEDNNRSIQIDKNHTYDPNAVGRVYVSSEVIFYSVDDLIKMTGWSRKTVQRMFRDPEFHSVQMGRKQLIENHALIEYFSVKRVKEFIDTGETDA